MSRFASFRVPAAALAAVLGLAVVPGLPGTAHATHTIQSVSPPASQNNRTVEVVVTGTDLLTAQLGLRRTGTADTPIAGTKNLVTSTATRLAAAVDLTLASPGTYDVVVTDGVAGPPGVGTAHETVCGGCFTVASPPPSATSVARESSTANLGRLKITGAQFAKGATVGFYLPGTTTRDTLLSFTPDAVTSAGTITGSYTSTNAAAGPRDVRVTNTDTTFGVCAGCFNVPAVASISPSSRGAGATHTLTIAGDSFAPGSTVVIGSDKTQDAKITMGTPTVTSNVITTVVTIAADAPQATKDVTVIGPDGGYAKQAGIFTVAAAPTISGVSPSSRGQGARSQTLAVTGANFASPTFEFVPATGITIEETAVSGAGSATLRVSIDPGASTTGRGLKVTNPDGGTTTMSNAFSVAAGPTVSSVSPSSRVRGSSGPIVVTGTGFDTTNGVQLAFDDPTIVVTNPVATSATQITATVSIPADAVGGLRRLTVTNTGNAGRGTCGGAGCFGVDTAGVSPAAASNTGNVTLTINGGGYSPDAVVQLLPEGRPTYQPTLTASSVAVAGDGSSLTAVFNLTKAAPLRYDVNVTGGLNRSSCGNCFSIVAAAPSFVASGLTPSSRGQNAVNQLVQITGSGFANGAAVEFTRLSADGNTVVPSGVTVVPGSIEAVSPTLLRFRVDVAPGALATNQINVKVANTDGQSATCANCFTVNRGPSVKTDGTGVTPATRGQGATSTVTVTGQDFTSDATVSFGDGVATGAPSAALGANAAADDVITVPVTVGQSAAPGARDVVVTNGDGGRYVCTGCFTVNAAPTFTGVTPAIGATGATVDVTIAGGGFASPVTVDAGPGISASTLSTAANQVTARLVLSPGAALGLRSFGVTNGDGGRRTLADAFRVITVPAAPTGVSAVRGDQSATVSWTPPATDNGSPVSSYTVTASPGGITAPASATATSATVTGLTNGTAYTFTVVATNAAGNSAASAPSSAVTPAGVPGAPTGLGVVPGDSSILVSWTAPTSNGDTITQYVVTASPDGATTTVAGDRTSATLTGLANGTAYRVTVVATNAVGDGPTSAPSDPAIPYTVPGAPTAVEAVRGHSSALVSWTPPAFDGGRPVTAYTVTAAPGGATATVDGDTTQATVAGLVNGTEYTFTVVATNLAGDSAPSAQSAVVVPAAVPDAPTAVTAARGNGSALVSWTAPADNGSPITGYTVTATPGGATATAPAGATSATVSGLDNGTAYVFRVVATNAVGDSPASAASAAVTPATLPGAPTGVTATRGNGEALVSWTAPASDGGSPVGSYTVTATPGSATRTVSGTSATVPGLLNGTAYTFTVVARNDVGESAASAPSAPVTPAGVPDAPTGVTATRGNGSATVSWTASADNGSPITGYRVAASPGEGTWTTSGTSAVVTGLTNGTAYTFTVVALNDVGESLASEPSTAVTPATVPDAPTGVTATRGNGSAVVSWTPPASNGGSAVTGYTVTVSPGGATVDATEPTATVTGLANGTEYTFTVVAINGVGSSVASAPSAAVVPAAVPGAPTDVTATRGDGSATVSWTAPAANGSPITGYTVTASPGGATATTSGTSTTVSGLTNGTSYTFTVVATNDVGSSPASAASAPVVPAGVPGAPTGVTATAGNGSAVVSWTAPATSNGSPITGYTVTASPGGATATAPADATSATVSGLTNGTAYTFVVTAANAAGSSAASDASAPVTPKTVPNPPTSVTATPGDAQATVSWTPGFDGGSPVTSYQVTASPGGATTTVGGAATGATVAGLTNGVPYTFTVVATNAAGSSPASAASAAVTPLAEAGEFVPVTPKRLLDTRAGSPLARGQILNLDVTGVGGVPADGVTAVVLNVTVTRPTTNGFLTVFPAGAARPGTSNLNFVAGQTVPNLVSVKVGPGGLVSMFNGSAGTTDVLADVVGFYSDGTISGSPFAAVTPKRLLDTRNGTGAPTGAVARGATVDLEVADVAGIPSDATAVVLNVTATQPSTSGFVTVFPDGVTRPGTSNLNYPAGRTIANLVVVKVGESGKVRLYNGSTGTVHLLADVVGYFAESADTTHLPLAPVRLLDTRNGTGAPAAALTRSQTLDVDIAGVAGLPETGVKAVVLNVTATRPTAHGFLTVFPDGMTRPGTSNLNFLAGQTVPNLVVVKVGSNGRISLFNGSAGTTHVLADVVGYYS